jgi:hypothetical protein
VTDNGWRAFAVELAATFPRLADDDAVILEHEGCPTVQFVLNLGPAGGQPALHLEAFTDDVLPAERKYGPQGAARLAALGWRTPNPPVDDNWRVQMAWPFSGRAAWSLALLIVDTLRDVFAVTAPGSLSYQAFNVASHADLDFPVLAPLRRLPR